MDSSYCSTEDISYSNIDPKGDLSLCDQLSGFDKLRISALTKAAQISPLVKKVTIGPNSQTNVEKDEYIKSSPECHVIKEGKYENLIEDKLRNDLRFTLILKEYETKLQMHSEEIFRQLVEKMVASRNETMRKLLMKQSEECKRKEFELKERELQLLKQLQENDNFAVLEQARLDEQKARIINRQTIENMNRKLEEQNKATARFAAITSSHTKINICYNEILNLINIEPHANVICDRYTTAMDDVKSNINIVLELCKTGAVTDKEVKQSEILISNIENIKKKILDDISEIKKQEISKAQKLEEVRKKKELEEKIQKENAAETAHIEKALSEQVTKTKPIFYSQKNYTYYEKLKNYLEQYENQYKDLLENASFKKFRFDCQKAVNTPINSLSSLSGSHIKDKYEKLTKLLKGETVQISDSYVNATQHPQGLAYCTALLAKKIVRQGDLLVSSNPEAAFPLAAVTVALWTQFPKLGMLLEANFYKQCPYLVPMFLPQKEGQTDKEFYMSRGYTYNDEGVVEKHDKFLKRMSGIFRLQCAVWIAKVPKFINSSNPQGLQHGWKWLASFLNLKPEPDICATLLHDFFVVCGSECLSCYRKQFTKIISLTSTEYLTILQNIDEGGPKTRLEVFLQNVINTGQIAPPSGQLPPNTW